MINVDEFGTSNLSQMRLGRLGGGGPRACQPHHPSSPHCRREQLAFQPVGWRRPMFPLRSVLEHPSAPAPKASQGPTVLENATPSTRTQTDSINTHASHVAPRVKKTPSYWHSMGIQVGTLKRSLKQKMVFYKYQASSVEVVQHHLVKTLNKTPGNSHGSFHHNPRPKEKPPLSRGIRMKSIASRTCP